ncbi:hypothetical protein KQX54_012386 [Cotesia glomerata]|uniref:Uncharacterized protein n=1 Tax=Cotesia glomerata TaxID=32391 RepID=A0AAV7ISG0_COTGL|nr:hypothetical protein KQX54_012386 [Cotesia glomerata]
MLKLNREAIAVKMPTRLKMLLGSRTSVIKAYQDSQVSGLSSWITVRWRPVTPSRIIARQSPVTSQQVSSYDCSQPRHHEPSTCIEA